MDGEVRGSDREDSEENRDGAERVDCRMALSSSVASRTDEWAILATVGWKEVQDADEAEERVYFRKMSETAEVEWRWKVE